MLKKIFVSILILLTITACGRDLSSNVYTSDSTLSLTMEGKVISVRPVTIKKNDVMGNNTTGQLAGGLGGAVAGANMGAGSGQLAAVAGGVVVGAIAGAAVEGALSTNQGLEYIVKVDTKNLKDREYEGSGAMRDAISAATTNGLITVVQGKEDPIAKGQKVYVIFSEKRTRVIPAS